MLEWQKKKYSVKDFVTIVLFQSCSGRLDYETRVEYGTSWYSGSGFSIRRKVQLQPHIVYLALSSEVKVGVTVKHKCQRDGSIKVRTKPFLLWKFPIAT
jgi:hypothetical protein